MQDFCRGFKLIHAPDPHWMILGTMPSVQSLEHAFYYAHPRNAFWPIMSDLVDMPISSEAEKVALVKRAGLVLWDVLQSCERKGSLDSAIKDASANDFAQLFLLYPTIKTVVFNGQKAEQLFTRYVVKKQQIPADINYLVLPSTSPANAAKSFEDKRLFWQEKLSHLV